MANISSTINKPVLISSTLPVYTSSGSSPWILATGLWNDSGVWSDTDVWID